jgi:copper oxidase (laccase) domain-containing protein
LKTHKTTDSVKATETSESQICFYNSTNEFLEAGKNAIQEGTSASTGNATESHEQMFLDLEQLERSLDQSIGVEQSTDSTTRKTINDSPVDFEQLTSVTNNSSVF